MRQQCFEGQISAQIRINGGFRGCWGAGDGCLRCGDRHVWHIVSDKTLRVLTDLVSGFCFCLIYWVFDFLFSNDAKQRWYARVDGFKPRRKTIYEVEGNDVAEIEKQAVNANKLFRQHPVRFIQYEHYGIQKAYQLTKLTQTWANLQWDSRLGRMNRLGSTGDQLCGVKFGEDE